MDFQGDVKKIRKRQSIIFVYFTLNIQQVGKTKDINFKTKKLSGFYF